VSPAHTDEHGSQTYACPFLIPVERADCTFPERHGPTGDRASIVPGGGRDD